MMRELKFMMREKAVWVWVALGFVFSLSAVSLGMFEVNQQRTELQELIQLDTKERETVLADQSDWGSAAYYVFHVTADPPSDFAFAALGQRDVSPWKHRVRMLALEGQIYETDTNNPDFAMIGRFDFTFVVTLIGPLLVILLLFDLRSGEQTAGRLRLIEANAPSPRSLWLMRAVLRVGLLSFTLCLPLFIGAILSSTPFVTLLLSVLAVVAYLAFWTILTLWLTPATRTGSYNLTIMLGVWLFIAAIIPATMTQIIKTAVPLPDNGDIVLTQREAVNDAWDLPKPDTYKPFLERHPEWADYTGWDSTSFEWKWYYAFQQVGDQTVEPLSRAYREGRAKRDRLAGTASLISPATALQRTLERLAATDMTAALSYENQVREFHAELRSWHYPRMFKQDPYSAEDASANLPTFKSFSAQPIAGENLSK